MECSSYKVRNNTPGSYKRAVRFKKSLVFLFSTVFSLCALAVAEYEFDAPVITGYWVIPADFNGDGVQDALLMPNQPGSAVIRYDSESDYLRHDVGIGDIEGLDQPLSSLHYHPVIADLNGDRRSDVILQSQVNGHAVTLLASAAGDFERVHETINRGAYATDWSYAATRMVAGDFNGDGRDDVLLQSRDTATSSVVAWSDTGGEIARSNSSQMIPDDHLGLNWSGRMTEILIGNFNGQDADGEYRDDVLLRTLGAAGEQLHAVVLADRQGELNTLHDRWNNSTEPAWGDRAYRALVGDFDHDGRDDVLLRSYYDGSGVLLVSQTGVPFSRTTGVALSGPAVERMLQRHHSARQFSNHQQYALTLTTRLSPASITGTGHLTRAPRRAVPVVTAVGEVQGALSVNGGVANYTVPLMVPPGRNHMQPQLALRYTHTGGNGHVGLGWNISGQSSIARCSARASDTLYDAQQLGGVTFTSKDRFCLDGQRLLAVSGTYGASSALYRTEIDTFAKIQPNYSGATLFGFSVYTRDNLIMTYGGTADSRFLAHQHSMPLEWKLSSVTDLHGNEMRYHYTKRSAPVPGYAGNKVVEHYLSEISYTHHSSGNDSNLRKIKFVYAEREDVRDYYRAGSRMMMHKRLERVRVSIDATATTDGTLIREYSLFYETGATRRSRLTEIYECTFGGSNVHGDSVASACLPPTKFTWQGAAYVNYDDPFKAVATTIQSFYAPSVSEDFGSNKVPADVDGDGRVDFIDLQASAGNANAELEVWSNAQSGLSKVAYTLSNPDIDASVLRSSFGVIDHDSNGTLDYMIPAGEPQTVSAPGNVSVAPLVNGEINAPRTATISWTPALGSVDHYELYISQEQPAVLPWEPILLTVPGDQLQAQYLIRTARKYKSWRFGVRACATGGSSYCGNMASSAAFDVCDVDGNCDGPVVNHSDNSVVQVPQCNAPAAQPSRYLSIVSLDPADGNNQATASLANLTNIPVNAVSFADDQGSVSYDANSYFAIDVNGDGRTDIVTRDVDQWYVFLRTAAVAGVASDRDLYQWSGACLPAAADKHVSVLNYDGDGRQDLLVERTRTNNTSELFVYRANGAGFDVIPLNIPGSFSTITNISGTAYLQPAVQPIVADINGDRLSDLIIAHDAGGPGNATRDYVHLYLNTGDGYINDTAATQTPIRSPGTRVHSTRNGMRLGHYIALTDADGDGDLDLFIPDEEVVEGYGPCVPGANTNNCNPDSEIVSLNDGYQWAIAYYDGGRFTAPQNCAPACATMTLRSGTNVDIDSNGRFEFLAEAVRAPNQASPQPNPYVLNFGGQAPDLIDSITEAAGYINRVSRIVYEPLQVNSDANVYSYTQNVATDGLSVDLASTAHVVQRIEVDNGVDNLANVVRYRYENARYDKTGRGFLGFASITQIDDERGIASRTGYHQSFPLTGLPVSQAIYPVSNNTVGTQPLSHTSFTWHTRCTSGPCDVPRVRFPGAIVTDTYDPLNLTAKLTRTRVSIESVDEFGNIPVTVIERSDGAGNVLHRMRSATQYHAANTASWWITRPSGVTVAYTAFNAQGAVSSHFEQDELVTHDTGSRVLQTRVVEPGDTHRSSVTSYQYTNAGQLARVTSGAASVAVPDEFAALMQQVHALYSGNNVPYFPSGISTRTNQQHPSALSFSSRHGRIKTFTDVNNESATPTQRHFYDGFGRTVRVESVAQPPLLTLYSWETGGCPAQAVRRVVQTRTGSPTTFICIDRLNRIVRQVEQSFSGANIYADIVYDRQGRIRRYSEPDHSAGAQPNGETVVNNVDYVGRPTSVTKPDGVTLSYTYNGLTTITTTSGNVTADRPCTMRNDAGALTCQTVMQSQYDALGQLISTTDARGKITSFKYDAYGNVVAVTDPLGHMITHQYDVLNRLIETEDPNLGFVRYEYDVLGQLVRRKHHTSPGSNNGRTVHTEFDGQGRQVRRFEQLNSAAKKLTGVWTYDVAPLDSVMRAPYIDRLSIVQGHGINEDVGTPNLFEQTYAYTTDTGKLSGVVTRLTHASGVEQFDRQFEYFSSADLHHGKLRRALFPGNIAIDYSYTEHGYASHETSSDVGLGVDAMLRRINARNARGQVLEQEFAPASGGVGLFTQNIAYQNTTGQIQEICTSAGSICGADSDPVQHLTQSFDALSLPQRKTDLAQGISQDIIERDVIGRLKKIDTDSPVSGALPLTTYAYDDVGNFTVKSDWGSYNYGVANGAKPYQVKSVSHASGAISYTHDAYGNMSDVTGTGGAAQFSRTTTYTFANKPRTITQGDTTSTFFYSPDQQRYKQVTATAGGDTVTTYYAGDSERVVTTRANGDTEQISRHYIGGYLVHSTVDSAFDTDGDGVSDLHDNCRLLANPDQRNTDPAGFEDELGNRCDADYDNDGDVDFADYGLLTSAFQSDAAQYNLSGDAVINFADIHVFASLFAQAPGPGAQALKSNRFLLLDELGSVNTVVDANGNELARYRYDAYGQRYHSGSQNAVDANDQDTVGYTGHEHLNPIGLIHMNGRLYDPDLGRFASVDPVLAVMADSQSYAAYSYARNMPFSYTDSSGYDFTNDEEPWLGPHFWENDPPFLDPVRFINQQAFTFGYGIAEAGGGSNPVGTGPGDQTTAHDTDPQNNPVLVPSEGAGGAGRGAVVAGFVDGAKSVIAPNVVALGERGVPGTATDNALGASKAVGNMGIGLLNALAQILPSSQITFFVAQQILQDRMPSTRIPEFVIQDDELLGAATFDIVSNLAVFGIVIRASRLANLGRTGLFRRRPRPGSSRAYHHTMDDAVDSIMQKGLRSGTYVTPKGNLSPLQAKLELALPGNKPRNAVIEIDLDGLRAAGFEIPKTTRISARFGLPGGGYEIWFPYKIPPKFLRVIQP